MKKPALKQLPWQHNGEDLPVASHQTHTTRSINNSLTPIQSHILREVRRELSLDCASQDLVLSPADIEETVRKVATRLGVELTSFERDELLSHIESDSRPFGILQQLVDNRDVTDIIITNHCKIAVQQGRRNVQTDLCFPDLEAYEAFVERLLYRAGASYSTKKPISDGMIGSFARVHAVHRALCESGPYLTIRLNRFPSVSCADLVHAGLAPQALMDYLRAMVRIGGTLMIAGEVGTGKTTLVRALASTMPAEDSILVIEDTQEIRLEHPHVRYLVTRDANTDGAGRITPSECIRGGMRMAMNRIVFGEIRDAEAAEAFIDVCSSGHPGLSTIHARSSIDTVARLELFLARAQRGAAQRALTEQVATAVQAVVHVGLCKETGKRRILEVREIGPVADGVLRQREIFKYQPQNGLPAWRLINRSSAHREAIEEGHEGVKLSELPPTLEFDLAQLYKESAFGKAA